MDDVASSIEQMDEQRAKGMKAQAQAFGNYLEPIEELKWLLRIGKIGLNWLKGR